MKIVVENKLIETKEIVSIEESGRKKHGLVINLIDGSQIKIEQDEVYDIMPSECGRINDRYRALREKVKEYWEKDKTDIPILKL